MAADQEGEDWFHLDPGYEGAAVRVAPYVQGWPCSQNSRAPGMAEFSRQLRFLAPGLSCASDSMRDLQPLPIASALTYIALLEDLSPEEIACLARSTREIQASRGQALFYKGEACTGLHLLLYGQVKLFLCSAQGNERVVEVVEEGQGFGEATLFMGQPYPVSAEALGPSRVLHVGKGAVLEVLRGNHRFAGRMLAAMARRQLLLMADVEGCSFLSARQRVVGYLLGELEDGEQEGRNVVLDLQVRKGVIASSLNLTQEHFSRILHELSEQGLIAVAGKRIRIADARELRRYRA